MTISAISAEEISDSRGRPTLRVRVRAGEAEGVCEVPSGASTGASEAHELRDPDSHMKAALTRITEIEGALRGMAVHDQARIDAALIALDGTQDRSRLGGNSMIGVSIAAAKAAAKAQGQELYLHLRSLDATVGNAPMHLFINLFNGGKHAPGSTPFQEHQIIVSGDMREALEIAQRVQFQLSDILSSLGKTIGEGDEGGVTTSVSSVEEPFAYLREAIDRAHAGAQATLGADIAASSIERSDEGYLLYGDSYAKERMMALYKHLTTYGLAYIEDPFEEQAFEDFAELQSALPETMIIGDDLTTTSEVRLMRAIEQKSIRGIIIKPNQVGTVSETIATIRRAHEAGIHCIVSHRSGETMDDFVADVAFAFRCFGLKAGAPHKPERRVKYDRLISLSYAA